MTDLTLLSFLNWLKAAATYSTCRMNCFLIMTCRICI